MFNIIRIFKRLHCGWRFWCRQWRCSNRYRNRHRFLIFKQIKKCGRFFSCFIDRFSFLYSLLYLILVLHCVIWEYTILINQLINQLGLVAPFSIKESLYQQIFNDLLIKAFLLLFFYATVLVATAPLK